MKTVFIGDQTIEIPDTMTALEVSGEFYEVSEGTEEGLIRTLLILRHARVRVRIEYGDPKTGKLWGDRLSGYIGRSMGPLHALICVPQRRSSGGVPLLTDCILRISHSNKQLGGVIYEHPNFRGES